MAQLGILFQGTVLRKECWNLVFWIGSTVGILHPCATCSSSSSSLMHVAVTAKCSGQNFIWHWLGWTMLTWVFVCGMTLVWVWLWLRLWHFWNVCGVLGILWKGRATVRYIWVSGVNCMHAHSIIYQYLNALTTALFRLPNDTLLCFRCLCQGIVQVGMCSRTRYHHFVLVFCSSVGRVPVRSLGDQLVNACT